MNDGPPMAGVVLIGDLIWVLVGIILFEIESATPSSMLQGFVDYGTVYVVWIAAGGILGLATFAAILDFADGGGL